MRSGIRGRGPRFYQSTLFVPYVLSYVLISYFVFALLSSDSGLIDKVLTSIGLPSVDWYTSPEPWRVILTLVNIWKNAGFWSIVYWQGCWRLALNIRSSAHGWRQQMGTDRSITLPLWCLDHHQFAAESWPDILRGLWPLLSGTSEQRIALPPTT